MPRAAAVRPPGPRGRGTPRPCGPVPCGRGRAAARRPGRPRGGRARPGAGTGRCRPTPRPGPASAAPSRHGPPCSPPARPPGAPRGRAGVAIPAGASPQPLGGRAGGEGPRLCAAVRGRRGTRRPGGRPPPPRRARPVPRGLALPRGHADDGVQSVRAGPQGRPQGRDGHVALPAAPGGQGRGELAREVRARPLLVRQESADPGGHLHGRRQPPGRGPRLGVEQPHVPEDHTPMAYGKADPVPEDARVRGGGDADRALRPGDAEALEPGADRRGGPPGQDRPRPDRVHRGVVVAVVGAEGDQAEVAVLQGRRGPEERGDLVHQVLVIALHRPILAPSQTDV